MTEEEKTPLIDYLKSGRTMQNSTMLKKDNKGNYTWEIKQYYDEDYEKAIEKIEHINEIMQNKFKNKEEKESENE